MRRNNDGTLSAAGVELCDIRAEQNQQDCENVMQQPIQYRIPSVVVHAADADREYDIQSMLLKHRTVSIGLPITTMVSDIVVAELLYLQ
jgi:ATP-dependent protease ClpP protease subunit